MMFPHTVTLIKRNNDEYTVQTVSGVYWVNTHLRTLSNEQMDVSNAVNIYLPLSKDVFDVGDIVMKGAYDISITSVADLEDYDYATITSKAVHDVGSRIDNVVLQCR